MDIFMRAAIDEGRLGAKEGGIPIDSVFVRDGRILGRGHNRRVQKGSAILHAEMDALENAVVGALPIRAPTPVAVRIVK
jgi:cytosine/creatinine deaminase